MKIYNIQKRLNYDAAAETDKGAEQRCYKNNSTVYNKNH